MVSRLGISTKGESVHRIQTNTCVHHWIIDAPSDRVSKGRCKFCGEVREFFNYWEEDLWGSDWQSSADSKRVERGSGDNSQILQEFWGQ